MKRIKHIMIILGLLAALINPKEEVKAMAIAPELGVAGVAAWLGGSALLGSMMPIMTEKMDSIKDLGMGALLGLAMGLVALEDTQGPSGHWRLIPLGPEQANKLGIPGNMRTIYNAEIDELNSLAETITREGLPFALQLAQNSSARSAESTAVLNRYTDIQWKKFFALGMISPESYGVLQIIRHRHP